MTAQTIVPCLWFDDQAEPAARFYTTTFPGGRVTARSRYPESFDNPGGRPLGSVLTERLPIWCVVADQDPRDPAGEGGVEADGGLLTPCGPR